MITLITGTPGAGKTLYVVSTLAKEYEGRPIFYINIKDLLLPWLPFSHLKNWREELPENAVLIVDEAQMQLPLRPASQDPPDWIKEFTTHRHRGVDFVFITQHPTLVDAYVRKLVGQHRHIHRALGWSSATVYRWDYYDDGFLTRGRQQMALRARWSYPKDAFGLYKSAEVHTVRRKFPLVFVWGPACLVVAGVLLWSFFHRMANLNSTETVNIAANKLPKDERGKDGKAPKPLNPADPAGFGESAKAAPQFDWQAAKFAKLDEPKRAPHVYGCVATQTVCKCYHDDGSLSSVPETYCREYMDNRVFAYWLDAPRKEGPQPGEKTAAKGNASEPLAQSKGPLEVLGQALPRAPITIGPDTRVNSHRSSDWSVPPQYQ